MLSKIRIKGLRGFSTEQELRFAVPNGQPGSGLTVLVGGNNSGKSTVLEALSCVALADNSKIINFPKSMRNAQAGRSVRISAEGVSGEHTIVSTREWAVSEVQVYCPGLKSIRHQKIIVLPSRRSFAVFFGASHSERPDIMANIGFPALRQSKLRAYGGRLFAARHNFIKFNAELAKVLDTVPHWSIELNDHGQHYLQINPEGADHTSDGLGQGIVSVFSIIDALYDSKPGDTIAIDEPELSLHPALQRRLGKLFEEYTERLSGKWTVGNPRI